MKKRRLGIVLGLVFGVAAACSGLSTMDSEAGSQLKLEPAPKEVQLRDGGFKVGPKTKILVLMGHQSEDRIAAETLAEEVADQSGLKLDILGMKAAGKAADGAIVLARLQDEAVGEDGYILFSSKSHLIVAAKTGQGLFYGVQTLRQLLRPEGKGLLCPAVGIRDWPNLEKTGGRDDVSRGTVPEILQFRGPGK